MEEEPKIQQFRRGSDFLTQDTQFRRGSEFLTQDTSRDRRCSMLSFQWGNDEDSKMRKESLFDFEK